MTLDEALQYLETTARVSCPQITCEQAGEIAGLLRDLSDQHQVDIAEMVSWKIHAQVLHERDEARAKLRKAEERLAANEVAQKVMREMIEDAHRERQAEIDCGQSGVCAKSPGCQKHWAFKASELVREQDEARRSDERLDWVIRFASSHGAGITESVPQFLERLARERDEARQGALLGDINKAERLRRYHAEHEAILARQRQAIDALMSERDDRERDGQIACGFAWDAGREMARLEECLQQCGLQAFMRNRSPEEVAGHMKYIADSWDLERKRLIDALCKRGECRHFVCPGKGIEPGKDFDADDYAKPGKR